MENKNVPSIRFKGFLDDWEQRKFFDSISSTIDFRGRTPKKLGMEWSESGYLALSALNVKSGYIDLSVDAHYGDEELYSKWMGEKILRKGQVIFTTEAPMGNVAQIPDDKGYILSQRTIAFEIKEDMMTNDFLTILLNSPLVSNHLSALSSGGTAKGVSQKSLRGLSVNVPSDIDEQQKIGLFFKRIDESIALYESELKILKLMKKGFLQQLFPENKQLSPNIRFENFQEKWQQRKLGEIVIFFSGLTYSPENVKDKGTLVLRSSNIKNNNIISADDVFVDDTVVNCEQVQIGDVIVVVRNGSKALIGKHAIIDTEMNNTVIGAFMTGIRSKSPYFINAILSTRQFNKEIEKNLGATINQITTGSFKRMEFIISKDTEEQTKIGDFFKEIDKTISLQEEKLKKLKETKKSFLHKIFI
ncbi:restriction endonuclease subunit S [Vagococcus fluvialis]|uniref:restriction endonuclease subunit S n=1 Tax=Vagococcus fluvialis TaxID=2738 RepID=UPI00379C8B36